MKDQGPPQLDHRGLAVGETHRQNHGRVDFGGAGNDAAHELRKLGREYRAMRKLRLHEQGGVGGPHAPRRGHAGTSPARGARRTRKKSARKVLRIDGGAEKAGTSRRSPPAQYIPSFAS